MTRTIRKQEIKKFIIVFHSRQDELKKQLIQETSIKHRKLISCEIKALDVVLKSLKEEFHTLSNDIGKCDVNPSHYLLLEKSRFL